MGYSMYDPYEDAIRLRVEQGQPRTEVFREIFGESKGYSINTFLYFCKSRNIRCEKEHRRDFEKCQNCKECGVIEPYYENKDGIMYCKMNNKQIRPNLTVAPIWCPKKGEIYK